jgi:hypothetical protein
MLSIHALPSWDLSKRSRVAPLLTRELTEIWAITINEELVSQRKPSDRFPEA